jgi:hypothetical protein
LSEVLGMSDGPIWRPNSVSPAEWDRRSREQQIEWWKAKERNRPAADPLRVADLYHKGIITEAEISAFVFEKLTEENVQSFLDRCPSDVLLQLRQDSESLPADGDDPGWAKLLRFGIVCYAPWVTEQEIRHGQQERDRRFRQGVQVFRAYGSRS